MSRRHPILVNVAGTLVAAGLTAVTWVAATEVIDASPQLAPDGASVAAPVASLAPDVKPVELSSFSETLARPVFNVSRRPGAAAQNSPEQQAVAAVASADDAGTNARNLRLIGIIASEGNGRRALIVADGDAVARWADIGAEFGNWKLSAIEADRVVVESAGVRSVLTLYPAKVAVTAE